MRALRREDVYDGSELDRIPDILIDFGEHPYVASDRLAASSIVERLPAAVGGGRHRRYGILLALGPGVTAGEIDGANIVDLAPTALHAMGLPVPDDMDGRVLTDLFSGRPAGADGGRGRERDLGGGLHPGGGGRDPGVAGEPGVHVGTAHSGGFT